MKRIIILLIGFFILFTSCSKNIYGKYNTTYRGNKSDFFQITLHPDNTVEKTEIHTISNFSSGKFIIKEEKIICYLDSSKLGYPPDTLVFKLKGKKLYQVRKGVINKKFYLKKEDSI